MYDLRGGDSMGRVTWMMETDTVGTEREGEGEGDRGERECGWREEM